MKGCGIRTQKTNNIYNVSQTLVLAYGIKRDPSEILLLHTKRKSACQAPTILYHKREPTKLLTVTA